MKTLFNKISQRCIRVPDKTAYEYTDKHPDVYTYCPKWAYKEQSGKIYRGKRLNGDFMLRA